MILQLNRLKLSNVFNKPANITRIRSLTTVRPKMSPQLGYFKAGVITQSTFMWFFVSVFVSCMMGQFTTGHERHATTFYFTLIRFYSCVRVEVVTYQRVGAKFLFKELTFVWPLVSVNLNKTLHFF